MSHNLALCALGLLPLVGAWDQDGCTTIIASAGATIEGSAITSHANDCSDCDWRVAYVAAKDHAPGSMRPIYDAKWDQYPRLVDPSRSPSYTAAYGINSTNILGEIPQVNHTYATWEASYGLINEKGLGMGESTCPAYIWGTGTDQGGNAIFSIGNLMAVALERCETARCALQTMGDLAEQYGFYGEDPGIGGAGEAVTVVDRFGDAWLFHIMGAPKAKSGIPDNYEGRRGCLWVAAKIPEGHITVVANTFMIQAVNRTDRENFMFHEGLFDLSIEAGLWDGVGEYNFQKLMAPDLATFEYFPGLPPIPMYATLRVWNVMRNAAPSKNLKASKWMGSYPFSIQVDQKVSKADIMNWFRSHFEGTEFDMTLGAQAVPWQSPNRAEGGEGAKTLPGQMGRSSTIPRTSYTVVVESGGSSEPAAWFAPDASASSVFVPFYAAALSDGGNGVFDIDTYGTGSMKSFSFGKTGGVNGSPAPVWWAFDFLANWMELSYRNMSMHYVYPAVQRLQNHVIEKSNEAVMSARTRDFSEANKYLADSQTELQRSVVETWWDLAEKMVVRYNDQFFNFGEDAPTTIGNIGYPAFWLQMIGYDSGSYKPTWFTRVEEVPSLLPADEKALLPHYQNKPISNGAVSSAEFESDFDQPGNSINFGFTVLFGAICASAGGLVTYRFGPSKRRDDQSYRRLLQS